MNKIRNWNKFFVLSFVAFLLLTFIGCGSPEKESITDVPKAGISAGKSIIDKVHETQNQQNNQSTNDIRQVTVEKGVRYTSKEEVAAYIYAFQELPPNYITKREAHDSGWDNSKGNMWEVTDRKSIGGDRFYNREGLLPEADGRRYYECDINYSGGYRGAERIVYSNDGLIFYTEDHYQSFERLYQEIK